MCLEKHDLVISKLVAMREKDQEFALALLKAELVEMDVLIARAAELKSVPAVTRKNVQRWLEAVSHRFPI